MAMAGVREEVAKEATAMAGDAMEEAAETAAAAVETAEMTVACSAVVMGVACAVVMGREEAEAAVLLAGRVASAAATETAGGR